ncbi:TetR/AcrR family transcriptional regulator C-terminal domain-containing protein [Aurantimonas sp. MSK8Z-1]|uniref:TetR/AcrR family transcriptional regulator C-terminal domain-containing protein n=1 Tax=Mangrovibrevibacter kandeliae TaxID=2968473 RepID=UPI00211925BF|nr:TetR/AcrR family transcriptional regulator C-terminal domain-containing protein [Aurantimonas sp. MSK8Z-1]MCW4114043.1 TetR/AcrR family transcriptional regulator C-terminal domain-containing protein [Aurantimonas sp. MSK8Z-1]
MQAAQTIAQEGLDAPTERQRAVLDAALALLVDPNETLTMTSVARRASCSKETLYKWFGDRDGLLTATVQWQAAKVRAVQLPQAGLDRTALAGALEQFAADWLRVLSGTTSVALNRLAIGQAQTLRGDLGRIVLENGPVAMGRRLRPVLEAGQAAGLIACDDVETAFRTFFGLVVRDLQIRLLLGDRLAPGETEIRREAMRATQQFLALYGAGTGQNAHHLQQEGTR